MKSIIIIIVIIVLGGLGFWAFSQYQTTNTNTPTTTVTNTTATSNTNVSEIVINTNSSLNTNIVDTNTSVISPNEVAITGLGFSPQSITVLAGSTVTWLNNDSVLHHVAPDDHPSHTKYVDTWPDTGAGRIAGGEAYSFTFTTAGTYTYHDHLHPTLIGTVIVE
ncbi:plastocyanin/azurin family copper-binding protein [Patescibacteria group bacterium]